MSNDIFSYFVLILIIQLIPIALIAIIKTKQINRYGNKPSKVSISDVLSICIQKYFNFNDRATRTEYWTFTIISSTLSFLFTTLEPNRFDYLSVLFLIPSLSVATRRLHDINRSGWWQLLVLLPITGWILLIYFLCKPTQKYHEIDEL